MSCRSLLESILRFKKKLHESGESTPSSLPKPAWKPDQLKHECAWCKKHTGGPVDSPYVSHGICPDCFEKVMGRKPSQS